MAVTKTAEEPGRFPSKAFDMESFNNPKSKDSLLDIMQSAEHSFDVDT